MSAATKEERTVVLSIVGDDESGNSTVYQQIRTSYKDGITIGDSKYTLDVRPQLSQDINISAGEALLSRSHWRSIGWILVFDLTAITNLQSLEEYYNKYTQIIELVNNSSVQPTPERMILVGIKADLGTDQRLPKEQIEEFVRSKSVLYYCEFSNQSAENLQTTLHKMVDKVIKGPYYKVIQERAKQRSTTRKKKTRCVIL